MGKSKQKQQQAEVLRELALSWLQSFQDSVNAKDYGRGQILFSEGVIAFGTIAEVVHGLSDLVESQWKQRWPTSVDFSFDFNKAKLLFLGSSAVICSTWKGENIDGSKRSGRATLVLLARNRKDGGLEMKCSHSHFSLKP